MLVLKRKPSDHKNGDQVTATTKDVIDRTLTFLSMLEHETIEDDVLFKNTSYVDGWMIVRSYRDRSGFFNVGRGYALKDMAEFPMHTHKNTTECLFWVEGEITVEVDGVKHELNKDRRVVCVKLGQAHNTVAVKEGAMLIYIDVPEEKELG